VLVDELEEVADWFAVGPFIRSSTWLVVTLALVVNAIVVNAGWDHSGGR
jgi:hypothetical protein